MADNGGSASCGTTAWGIAALAGVLVAALTFFLGDWRFIQAVFAGIVVAVLLGVLFWFVFCRSLPGPVQATASQSGSATAKATAAAAGVGAAGTAAAATATAAAARPTTTSAPEPAPTPTPTPAPAPAPAPTPAPEPVAKVAPKSASKPKPAPAPAAAASAGEANPGTRPAGLDGPRGGQADDLKRIKGVGPAMERLCNELGFYHFDQISAWSGDEVAWVDQNLKGFKGRVTRDSWVEQARLLASGGETEFSKKVDDGGVY